MTQVSLKPIIDQLTECLSLPEGLKVSALVADNEEIIGWMIVKVYDDGTIKPTSDRKFKSLKELFNEYLP